jgi:hypothetical protein
MLQSTIEVFIIGILSGLGDRILGGQGQTRHPHNWSVCAETQVNGTVWYRI